MDRLTFTDEFRKEHQLGEISYLAPDLLAKWEAKLKAYEDTGLEPSEVAELAVRGLDERESLRETITSLNDDLAMAHETISTYRTAEEQGLLVRLPCKVGDEIFSFRWSIKNQKHEVCTGKVKNVRYDSVDSSVMVSDGEYYRVWGKTVFPTREEAEEEALKNG